MKTFSKLFSAGTSIILLTSSCTNSTVTEQSGSNEVKTQAAVQEPAKEAPSTKAAQHLGSAVISDKSVKPEPLKQATAEIPKPISPIPPKNHNDINANWEMVLAEIKKVNPAWKGIYILSGKNISFANRKKIAQKVFKIEPSLLSNIVPLRNFDIESIDLDSSEVSDLEPLKGIPLKNLNLSRCSKLDNKSIEALKDMKLESLSLTDCQSIYDISFLQSMTTLKTLVLTGTSIDNIKALHNLKLETLIINNTMVSDLSPLKGMKSLKVLQFDSTQVTSLVPLFGLNLEILSMVDAPCSKYDIPPALLSASKKIFK